MVSSIDLNFFISLFLLLANINTIDLFYLILNWKSKVAKKIMKMPYIPITHLPNDNTLYKYTLWKVYF